MKPMKQEEQFLSSYVPMMQLIAQYDAITDESMPDMTARIAKKEEIVTQIAEFIKDTVPLKFAVFAFLPGMRAGFARALGEAGQPSQFTFVALAEYAFLSGPTDYNLKHQILRAYRSLRERFPTNTDVVRNAQAAMVPIGKNADEPLSNVMSKMKGDFGLS